MIKDYESQLRQESDRSVIRRISHGMWSGVDCDSKAMLSSRLGRYFEAESCLVEIVLIWPDVRDSALMCQILSSIDAYSASNEGLQRWKAFGIDLWAPKSFALQKCTVEPARAVLSFTDSHRLQNQYFERLGMVSHWLKVPVSQWLREQSPKGIRISAETAVLSSQHSIETITGIGRLRMVLPCFGKRLHYASVAWICPKDGRLYRVCSHSFAPIAPEVLASRLSCCTEKEKSK